jgi:hypothetical protein
MAALPFLKSIESESPKYHQLDSYWADPVTVKNKKRRKSVGAYPKINN